MRSVILWGLLVMSIGTLCELILLGHTESFWQLLPVFVLALLVICFILSFKNQAVILSNTVKVLSYISLIIGLLGTILHYRGNEVFEKEMYPDISGWELFSEAMTGATPALAPGSMIALGIFGIAFIKISNNKRLS